MLFPRFGSCLSLRAMAAPLRRMGPRGKSKFVAIAWLCGSACNIYQGDSLKNEGQREQSATATREPRDLRNLEFIGFRSPAAMINLRPNSGSAPRTEPPVAGTRAPREKQAPDMDRHRREELENADDAGLPLERSAPATLVDAGASDADAGSSQRIETGRPREVDAGRPREVDAGRPREVDAGRPRPVARLSAVCRGELGYETDGRCYFVLDAPVSWNVGRDHCYEHDAHLASVTSERESDLIASFELEHDVWIGFSRFGAANFSWLTNESGSFSQWEKGAPRPMQESGALISASTGLWTNRPVPELHAALCETERKTK